MAYTLSRKKRKSVGFSINEQGLCITAPLQLSQAVLMQIIQAKTAWIHQSLVKQQAMQNNAMSLEEALAQGHSIPVLGLAHTVQALDDIKHPLINPWQQLIHVSKHQPTLPAVEKLLKTHAKTHFANAAQRLAKANGLPPFTLRLSSAKHRWGSCNSKREIRLNWRLIHYPPHLIDYVVAHELAHLLHMDHSPLFWKAVEGLLPDYQKAHKTLNAHTPAKMPRLLKN